MKKEIKANQTFEKVVVTRDQAMADAAKRPAWRRWANGPASRASSSSAILPDIPEGEPISYYKNGDFIDLCAGPHVMRTGNIGAFKLTTVASAYYKGDEKQPAAPAHLRHRLQEQDRDGGLLHDGGGGQTPRPSQDRPGDGPVCDGRGIRRPRSAALAAQRRRPSWRNWRSWPRKPNSPPATCA